MMSTNGVAELVPRRRAPVKVVVDPSLDQDFKPIGAQACETAGVIEPQDATIGFPLDIAETRMRDGHPFHCQSPWSNNRFRASFATTSL